MGSNRKPALGLDSDNTCKWRSCRPGLCYCSFIYLKSFALIFSSWIDRYSPPLRAGKRYLFMATILVTGGSGYIGSHTIVDLIENGFDVISVDNNSRSNPAMLEGVEKITGKKVKNYKVDLCNFDDTFAIFQENEDIVGIIHFAAYKAVGESVEKPLMYFENNLNSLINLLKCVQEFKIPWFVFSSSCTVYG